MNGRQPKAPDREAEQRGRVAACAAASGNRVRLSLCKMHAQGTELPAASSSQEEKAMMVQGQADDGSGAEGGDGLAA